MNSKDKVILLIVKDEAIIRHLKNSLSKTLESFKFKIVSAADEIDALKLFELYQPSVVFIEAKLQILNGFSLCAIIRGSKGGEKSTIYMIVNKDSCTETCENVDCFLAESFNEKFLSVQINRLFYKEKMIDELKKISDIQRLKMQQQKLLPRRVNNDVFEVSYIYSPFCDLSGDCLDYWSGQDQNGLYGFIFDVMGHDICSSFMVSEVRAFFRWGFKFYQAKKYQSLTEIMQTVNEEMFRLHDNDTTTVAAVAFYLDFTNETLTYCSAGIPAFHVKKRDVYEEIKMRNYLIGYKENSKFVEHQIPVKDVDEIVFSSDGLSDLLYQSTQELDVPKHDDVSAIFINLKRKRKDD